MTEQRSAHFIPGRFRELPIERKLMIALLFTAVTSLALAGAGIVAADSFLFYGYLQRDLDTLSQIIADNSTGALAFDEAKSGRAILATLRAREYVDAACLFRPDGSLLASYSRDQTSSPCPPPGKEGVTGHLMQQLHAVRTAKMGGKPVGTLTLAYSLDEIVQRIELYGGLVGTVVLVASLFAVAVSRKLRSVIAAPILELADSAAAVTQTKNYGIRAQRHAPDEVGALVLAFNEMLSGIQSRDDDLNRALSAQRLALEQLEDANADLHKVNEDLARSNKDLERFAYIASHDLQEPLRMITSYSQLLVKLYPPEGEGQQRVYMQRIVEGTRQMRRLLSDLLTYAEVSSNQAPAGPLDLNATLAKALENLRLTIEATGATITSENLPPLTADEMHLLSLFQNLIGNSLKYRSHDPPRIHVSVERNGEGYYTYCVADNGIGIEPQFEQSVFAAFKRLHGKDIPGTGIGLTICQRIVDRYGGKIWLRAKSSPGTLFCFTLPLAQIAEESSASSRTLS